MSLELTRLERESDKVLAGDLEVGECFTWGAESVGYIKTATDGDAVTGVAVYGAKPGGVLCRTEVPVTRHVRRVIIRGTYEVL